MKISRHLNQVFYQTIKLFLLPLITIIVVLILTFTFLYPRIQDIKTTIDKNKQDQEKLARLEKKARKLSELENSQLRSDFERIEALLPSEKNIPLIIFVLDQLGKQNNVIFDGIILKPGIIAKDEKTASPSGKIEKKGNLASLDFSLIVNGPYDSCLEFMSRILTVAPLFNIKSVTLSQEAGFSRVHLDLSTFYQSLPETLGKLDTPLAELSFPQRQMLEKIRFFTIFPESIEEVALEATTSAQPSWSQGIFQ